MTAADGAPGRVEEEIPAPLAGERVDRVVAMITGCTRAEAAAVIESGHVLVDDRPVGKASVKVREGQRLAVTRPPHQEVALPEADAAVELDVVHADDDVIVVDKPAGLVVHPGAGTPSGTLVNGLLAAFPEVGDVGQPERPGIVHRLDKGTSGLMVVARTEDAYEDLVAQLSTHDVTRRYVALVWGHLSTRSSTVDAPIGRSRRNPLRMTVATDGRPSRTHVAVTEELDDPVPLSLVECHLETGRTHQIRVHLRSIGHPVVGDDLYGGVRPSLRMDRPFLHAAHLRFDHPGTGESVSFDSELPADLAAVLADLRGRRDPSDG